MANAVGTGDRRSAEIGSRRARSLSSPGQQGFGLIEALVALVLTVGLVLTLASGLLFLIRTTDSNAELQTVQAAAAGYAEHLKAAPYQPCGTDADYQGVPGFVPPTGLTASVESVQYWEIQSAGGSGDWTTTCADDAGAQLLTVVAASASRTHRIQLVKADR